MDFQSPRFADDPLLTEILNDPDTGTKKLGSGSPPESVKRLQQALFDLGWTQNAGVTTPDGLPHTPATFVIGIYGPATTKTVVAYKTNYNIHFPPDQPTGLIDGFAGPRTFMKLDKQCVGLDAATQEIERKADQLRGEGHTVVLFTSDTVPTTHPVLRSSGLSREIEDFDGAIGKFYFKQQFGEAFEVHGQLFHAYLARGDATGTLGFPISDVHEDDPGFERSDFERGALRLNLSTGEIEQIDPIGGSPSGADGDGDTDF